MLRRCAPLALLAAALSLSTSATMFAEPVSEPDPGTGWPQSHGSWWERGDLDSAAWKPASGLGLELSSLTTGYGEMAAVVNESSATTVLKPMAEKPSAVLIRDVSVTQESDGSRTVTLRWKATEGRLSARPVTIKTRREQGTWYTVAAGLPNRGEHSWRLDHRWTGPLACRVELRESTGKTAADVGIFRIAAE